MSRRSSRRALVLLVPAIAGGWFVYGRFALEAAPPPCESIPGSAAVCNGAPLGPHTLPARGADAVNRLGSRLPEVAAVYGWSEAALGEQLLEDDTLWLDGNDQLFFAESLAEAGEASTDTEVLSVGDVADVFQLESRPGARLTIFLDFDGHTTEGTSWNSLAGGPIVSAPMDIDGNTSSFSHVELGAIQRTWLRVAEDFAPWDVNVTTKDPGPAAIIKSSSSDTQYGVRAVVTSTNWYGSASGVAYVGSFGWSSDTPVFVFARPSSTGAEKAVAEVASHETGHSLGLHHDGVVGGSAYYGGHGSWAPIMGLSTGRSITHWSKGEYPGADNLEDDLAIIASRVPVRVDDHGDVAEAATVVGSTFDIAGVISTTSDVDWFRFDVAAGTLTVQLVMPHGTNLDAQLTVVGPDGTLLGLADPSGLGGPQLSVTVPAGTVYARVDGVGAGDLATGYGDYGSLGRYVLTGTANAPASTPTPTTTTTTTTTTVPAPTTTLPPPPTTTTTTVPAPVPAPTTTIPAPTEIQIHSVTVHRGTIKSTAAADVVILDANGRPIAGVKVTGLWSGQTKGKASAQTDGAGVARTSNAKLQRSGTVTFTVTSVTPPAGSNLVWNGSTSSGSAVL